MTPVAREHTLTFGRHWLSAVLVILAVGRIVAAVYAANANVRGDYYASLPGAYVQTLNPTLWDSPDMEGAMGYHLDTYFHGPTQYLTLYAMAFFDSYRQIARALMPVYALVLAAAFWLMWRGMRRLAPEPPMAVPLFASTFLFFPLIQSYVQREFEVVILVALSAALVALVHDRRGLASVLLAYVAWFKYSPLIFAGWFALRRWTRALAAFAATSVVVLLLAHAAFGLGRFVNNNVPAHASQVLRVWDYGFARGPGDELYGIGFCTGWFESETTLANVRHGLCSLSSRFHWLAPNVVYLLLCIGVAAVYLTAHARAERASPFPAVTEAWRRALELSIVTTVWATFFFNHYYYLIVLILPLNVLLTRYLMTGNTIRLITWAFAYFFISAFVVPTSVLARLSGVGVWTAYITGAWFLYGELLLMALLLLEYWQTCSGPDLTSSPSAS